VREKQLDRLGVREHLVSAAVFLYVLISAVWLCPDTPTRKRFLEPVRTFWLYWGLDQNWSLFSPVIRDINFHTTATITFEDGTRMIWEPPRMERLSTFDRFRMEKFRKWDVDCLPGPNYKEFWPDFARFLGCRYYDAENKPVLLSLHIYWTDIPAPQAKLESRDPPREHTKFATVFTYRYAPEDFK
jgi:hypothetical protein